MIKVRHHAIACRRDDGEPERLRAVLPAVGALHPGAHAGSAERHQIHAAVVVQVSCQHAEHIRCRSQRVRTIKHKAPRRGLEDRVGAIPFECTRDHQVERAITIKIDRADAGAAGCAPRQARTGSEGDGDRCCEHRPARRLRHVGRRHDAHAQAPHAGVLELGKRAARVHREALEGLHRQIGGRVVARARSHALDAQLRAAQEWVEFRSPAVPRECLLIGTGELKALTHVEARMGIAGHGIRAAAKVHERLLRTAKVELAQADAVRWSAPRLDAGCAVRAKDRTELLDRALLCALDGLVHQRNRGVGQAPSIAVDLRAALEVQPCGLEVELPHQADAVVECTDLDRAQCRFIRRGLRATTRCRSDQQHCAKRTTGADHGAPCWGLDGSPRPAHGSSRLAWAMRSLVDSMEIAPVPEGAKYGRSMYGCALVRRCARMS